MDAIYDTLIDVFGDTSTMLLALLVFLAVGGVAFVAMTAVHARGAVKRRAVGINKNSGESPASEQGGLRQSSVKMVQQLLDYTTKHYDGGGSGDAKVLRRRMIQAGIY